jgi:hypothetical protein
VNADSWLSLVANCSEEQRGGKRELSLIVFCSHRFTSDMAEWSSDAKRLTSNGLAPLTAFFKRHPLYCSYEYSMCTVNSKICNNTFKNNKTSKQTRNMSTFHQ